MSDEIIKVAKSWYAALREGTWREEAPRIFTEDAIYLNFARAEDSPQTKEAIPWAGEWKGHAGIAAFQDLINHNFIIDQFDDHTYLAGDGVLAIFSRLDYRARATERRVVSDTATLMRFRDGRIHRYQFFENTLAIAASFATSGSWRISNSTGSRLIMPVQNISGFPLS